MSHCPSASRARHGHFVAQGQHSAHCSYSCGRQKAHLDARAPALGDRVGDRGPRRVDHGQEAHEAEAGRGKVHRVDIKRVGFWKLIRRQVEVTEHRWGRGSEEAL
uniref:Uncharacterized protein n=2 Tax=Sus scrofa TaxID=9823 RepID=A0A8D1QVY0_PIG